jgi:hypothetical protein
MAGFFVLDVFLGLSFYLCGAYSNILDVVPKPQKLKLFLAIDIVKSSEIAIFPKL